MDHAKSFAAGMLMLILAAFQAPAALAAGTQENVPVMGFGPAQMSRTLILPSSAASGADATALARATAGTPGSPAATPSEDLPGPSDVASGWPSSGGSPIPACMTASLALLALTGWIILNALITGIAGRRARGSARSLPEAP